MKPRPMLAKSLALLVALVFAATRAPLGAPAPAGERQLRLEAIEVVGNARTPEVVVLRHLALAPGDPVDADALEAARRRLVATDYFKTVSFSTRRGSERGAVVLRVEVSERGNPVFETGFGYHDLNGWYLTLLGLRLDNALGADSRFRVGARLGFRLAGLDAEWAKPVSSSGALGVGVKLFVYSIDHRFFGSGPDSSAAGEAPWSGTDWVGYQQRIGRTGGEVTLSYRAGEATRLEAGLSAARVDPDTTFKRFEDKEEGGFEGLPPDLQAQNEAATYTGALLRAFYDTRNDDVYPTRGGFARLTLNVNHTTLDDPGVFTKATLDLRRHARLTGGWVFSARASGGIVSRGTPYYERFYLGGNYSIRGFQEWSLSGTAGDEGFWTANTELRWPLAGLAGRPRLVGLIFLDAGQGWRHGETVTGDTVEAGAGYGLRLVLPWVGTLGMDVGIPITDGRTGDRFRVHLLLGFSF
jgi:outer membrane protein insertion porin family